MENPDLCKKLITEYVNNGGILDNYHSFNYILDENGNLELLEELYEIGYQRHEFIYSCLYFCLKEV